VNTEELVSLLASQAEPVDVGAGVRQLALALGLAILCAVGLTALLLGLNPALLQDATRPMFWAKEFFCLTLSAAGVITVLRLGRPGRPMGGAPIGIAAPLVAMWLLSAVVLFASPGADREAQVLGHTALVCPWLIAVVSMPVFIAFVWLMRGLAPTRLRWAGAAVGFAAGAIGALVYSLHCPEYAAPFLGVWYVLGILIPTLAGAGAGPRLLRW
jgi:hypothetical protein